MTYRLNPNYFYCVDLRHIQFIERVNECQLALDYPMAAVFDLILKQVPEAALVRMMAKIALVTESHARRIIHDTIDVLVKNDILIPTQQHG
ncbi:MAG: hypothetical protein ACOY90_08075 [Candidatus Zhuqueibacterota bacterium]